MAFGYVAICTGYVCIWMHNEKDFPATQKLRQLSAWQFSFTIYYPEKFARTSTHPNKKLPNSSSTSYRKKILSTPTSSTPADEAQIVELGDAVLEKSRIVAQLAANVLVVARPDGDEGVVGYVPDADDLEGHGQGLVGPPVGRQGRAQYRGAARLHEVAVVLLREFAHSVEVIHARG